MCWKCEEIDKEIGHYRGLSARAQDEGSVKSLDILIARLEAEKKEVHIAELDIPAKTAPPR
jgi:ferritin-like metal-binding protein YciE